MYQSLRTALVLTLSLLSVAVHASTLTQEPVKQVALVIGNAKYSGAPLKNPTNDSKDFAERLKLFGFDVVYRENLRFTQVGSMLREFKSKLNQGGTALIFYAGHGLQVRGENYFPVVDADITTEEDIPVQSMSLRQLMDILEEAKTATNIVILDACRNNPFDRRTRSLSRGLSKVSAPSGTLIAYSTRPGSVAEDGDGRNGVYTEHLLGLLDSHKPIEQVLKQLVTKVKSTSKGRQEPWFEGSLEGDFCFGGCKEDAEKIKLLAELADWDKAISTSKIEDLNTYLVRYPNGTYAPVAKKMIEAIRSSSGKSNQSSSNKNIDTESFLKQAEEAKRAELDRLEAEKRDKDKLIAATEERLRIEFQNRTKLDEDLKKAKQEYEVLLRRPKASEDALPKKIFVSPVF